MFSVLSLTYCSRADHHGLRQNLVRSVEKEDKVIDEVNSELKNKEKEPKHLNQEVTKIENSGTNI